MSVEELFDAIKRGDPKPINAYLEAGKDLNVKDEDGDTPLLYATKRGLSYLVKRFLEHGANPDARDAKGDTSLIIATKGWKIYATSQYKDPATGALMLMYGKPPSTYKYPNSLFNTVKHLLEYGANHELKDKDGKTALYYAGREGNSSTESLLYSRYSPLNSKTRSANSYPSSGPTKAQIQLMNIFGENENESEEPVNTFGIYASDSSSAPSSSAAASSSSAAAPTYKANMNNLQSSVKAKMSNFKGFRSTKNRKSKKANTRRRKLRA